MSKHSISSDRKSISSDNTETRSVISSLALVKSKALNAFKCSKHINPEETKPRKYDEKSKDSYEAKAAYMATR